jgi:hypothetical protein
MTNATQDPTRPHVTWFTSDPRDARIETLNRTLDSVMDSRAWTLDQWRKSTARVAELTTALRHIRDLTHARETMGSVDPDFVLEAIALLTADALVGSGSAQASVVVEVMAI